MMDSAPSPYLHISHKHATLSDALEEMADQLLSREDMLNEERLRIIDRDIPGPYPWEVAMRQIPDDDEDGEGQSSFVPDKENQSASDADPDMPYYETHEVDWTHPPQWAGTPIKEVPLTGPHMLHYLKAEFGVPIKEKVQCKFNGCTSVVQVNSFIGHLQGKCHFNVCWTCKGCGFRSRANAFLSSHRRENAQCHKDLERKLGEKVRTSETKQGAGKGRLSSRIAR
ncbi:hypothetical protein C8Q80DRAFT_598307 [Daedaleopsis nitida]|nr:hypothetical protein C8Q80DRAFT_598307 [Daedaleopsis nitida]